MPLSHQYDEWITSISISWISFLWLRCSRKVDIFDTSILAQSALFMKLIFEKEVEGEPTLLLQLLLLSRTATKRMGKSLFSKVSLAYV